MNLVCKWKRKITLFMLVILTFIAGIMADHAQAATILSDSISSQYMNSVLEYLYLGKESDNTFHFNINKDMKQSGASYNWYVKKDKGNPDSVAIDTTTGVVTAKEAGTAYIRCKITFADGSIIRPEAKVVIRNNITKVAISNMPKDYTIRVGEVMDFNRTILDTAAGQGLKTQGITRWELANDTAGVGTATGDGKVVPSKEGTFQIRAVCFQSIDKYKNWVTDKAKNSGYVTAVSEWATINVTALENTSIATNQEQLDKLLMMDGITQIKIATDEEIKLTIPKGDYTDKKLIVNAANADVENFGLFQQIVVNAIKDHTWIEFADGNIIHLNDDVVSFIISENVKVKQIVIDRPNSTLNLEIRGTVEHINVLQPSNLDITGTNEEIPVTVADTAGGSSIQASVPLNLTLNADTEVNLKKGAEATTLDKSVSTVEVIIVNDTENVIVITTDRQGGEKVEAGVTVISNESSQPETTPEPTRIAITAISNITGRSKVGVELNAGAITPAQATITYQWMISNTLNGTYTNIIGATTDKYTPNDDNQGKYIKVAVTGIGAYSGVVRSVATEAVATSEVKLQEAAELAITDYEDAPVTTLTEVSSAEALKDKATEAAAYVEEPIAKAAFEQRITYRMAIIAEVRLELEAEEAVTAYETESLTTLSEVTVAEGLKSTADSAVTAVVDTAVKVAFSQRITIRTAIIAEARLEFEVEEVIKTYEITPLTTLSEVATAEGLKSAAETAVSTVGNALVKAAFSQRITNRMAVIAEARFELEAEEVVKAYETSPVTTLTEVAAAQGLKSVAEAAVSKVADTVVKAAFNLRINTSSAIIAEVKLELEAEEVVAAYETAPLTTLVEVALAEGLKSAADTAVSAVGDIAIKEAFDQRITTRATVIAEVRVALEAEVMVIAYETTPLNNLTEVAAAESIKTVTDSAVSLIENTLVKTIMMNRIVERSEIIAEIRAELEAEEAVIAYETTPLTTLAEITSAEGLKAAVDATVTSVHNTVIRTALQIRVSNRAAIIAETRAEFEAEEAVHAYEVAPIATLAEVNATEFLKIAANAAASMVGDSTIKEGLVLRINGRAAVIAAMKAEFVAEKAISTYEAAPISTLAEVTAAEDLKLAADTAASAVEDDTIKAGFISRINNRANIIAEIRTQLETEAAISAYEEAPITTLIEVSAAEGLKIIADTAASAVGNAMIKIGFLSRISDRAAVIAETRTLMEAESAVEDYEMAAVTTFTEIADAKNMGILAEAKAAVVSDLILKTALLLRISDRTEIVEEAHAVLLAEVAVSTYEAAPLSNLTEVISAEELKAAADTAVSAVGNITSKDAFIQRMNERANVIAIARSELETETEVNIYETVPISTLFEISIAEWMKVNVDLKIAEIADIAKKAAFTQRVTERAAVIANAKTELEAEAAVKAYETALITNAMEIYWAESLKYPAEAAVMVVSNNAVRNSLSERINNRAQVITATNEVLIAENSLNQIDLFEAQALVLSLPFGSDKISLINRINAVQAIIYADLAVSMAETSTAQADVDTALLQVTALVDSNAKLALQGRIQAVQSIINDRIEAAANELAVSNVKEKINSADYSMAQSEANTEAEIKSTIEAIISNLELEGVTTSVTKLVYTPAVSVNMENPSGTDGAYTFTVALSKGAGATLSTSTSGTLTMKINVPEIILSKTITNFNFATINSSTASLVSNVMEESDFSGDKRKYFTITDGAGNEIIVDLYWNITSDGGFSAAELVGSAIESTIQDYFYAKGGVEALMNRTLWCASFGGVDTFTLSTFYEGLQNEIIIEGADATYFFSTLSAQGTDLDTSANKTITISDGANTANVTLNTDLVDMDGLVSKINYYLTMYSVKAVAVKLSENTFEIVGDNITISGTDKTTFFSVFISE